MSLVKLPYELVSFIIEYLDLLDVGNLSLTCKRMQYLTLEYCIAKRILETKAPYSLEASSARLTQRWPQQLRRLIKRQAATSSVSPYLVRVVAHAETWLYENGILCYIRKREIRILDLHGSATQETVINIRSLLHVALPESRMTRRYKVRVLHYAHDIVSCLYTHAKPNQEQVSWLLAFNVCTGQVVTVRQVASTTKIFVRNDNNFLYYGTNSEIGRDLYRYWVVWGFDLSARRWLSDKLEIQDVMGVDVGSTVCFEIFDGWFYGISNQAALEVEEVDWISHYTCFRFPVTREGLQKWESPNPPIFRRNQHEGVIDDRWYLLRMFKDESTGQLKVVESRKEWLAGRIWPRRTYYTTVVNFDEATSDVARATNGRASSSGSPSAALPETMNPKLQHTEYTAPPSRDPHFVHPGDDNASSLMFAISKSPIRCYYSACQTFLDVVDDPTSTDPNDQRIRFRGSSRRPRGTSSLGQRDERQISPVAQDYSAQDALDQEVNDLYRHKDVVSWPAEPDISNPDPVLLDLYAVLNPDGFTGNIRGAWDERSLVYSTGGDSPGGLNALVFVSWDPSIHLDGTLSYSDYRPSLSVPPVQHIMEGHSDVSDSGIIPFQEKGKGKEFTWSYPSKSPSPFLRAGSTDSTSSSETNQDSRWKKVEPALYHQLGSGFHFAR
ncbi:uncharacterized protein PODANS_2_700 [Podospora anserina S mat+]|uniref:Podospora anserina S mat+ genomic DNA chromosome 2, supercontig 2 n=1 Tax=Podospora anserina (strain S / ATCC MYA-4624 / DSM 980 / FGSC 10383) TaxID=515849 RepID=B2B4B4_PODAN|nr:uncharacterized protein PODANS_2_700 [Podospora anserina S mat+]CAP72639.1 unnamed protein product [Podospora anserina S mat+]CDP25034.1 Putative protein of unknown function [Podospora anserina S mat+]